MELEDKLDDTLDLENEDQNTDPNLDGEQTEPNTEDQDDSGSTAEGNEKDQESTESDIDLDILEKLDDDQFTEYLETGKLPDGIVAKPNTKKGTEQSTESASRTSTEKTTERVTDTKGVSKDSKKASTEDSTVDYKTVYDEIFKGFKANGKEIKPQKVEDVISLMQMGANYTKKMQAMVPMRKIVESLDKASIKEEDLNFLIDIHKGDKEAIKKLLERHKVDPMELDMESTNYVPKNNMLSDEDADYLNTVDEISSTLPKIKEIMDSKWDSQSKKILIENKDKLYGLHCEIEMGRFDEVQARLESEKTFGRYRGVSDIDAYTDIVTKMVTEQLKKQSTVPNKPNTPKKDIPSKKGAAPNKAVKAGVQDTNLKKVNFFDMSEEDFKKLSINDLV